jgi:hypothetical protein
MQAWFFRNFAFDGSTSGATLGAKMFEQRKKPLLPRRAFYARMARCLALAGAITTGSLGIGMAGYHGFEGLSWLDAFLNAAMILSGMGPVASLQTTGGKLFAGCYALFSGLALITTLAVIIAPLFHRFLHKFHMEADYRGQ